MSVVLKKLITSDLAFACFAFSFLAFMLGPLLLRTFSTQAILLGLGFAIGALILIFVGLRVIGYAVDRDMQEVDAEFGHAMDRLKAMSIEEAEGEVLKTLRASKWLSVSNDSVGDRSALPRRYQRFLEQTGGVRSKDGALILRPESEERIDERFVVVGDLDGSPICVAEGEMPVFIADDGVHDDSESYESLFHFLVWECQLRTSQGPGEF